MLWCCSDQILVPVARECFHRYRLVVRWLNCPLCVCDVRLRNILSVVGPEALKKSRRDEERAKRSQEEVSNRHT